MDCGLKHRRYMMLFRTNSGAAQRHTTSTRTVTVTVTCGQR
jgi:hypothetical protein